jgi:hypothetical protein
MQHYFVRIGSLAEIQPATGEPALAPGRRVIVRTSRGVELATIASSRREASISRDTSNSEDSVVRILRATSDEDELLLRRLDRHKRKAVESCREALLTSGSSATLLEVDQIFDGGTLLMHFLGPVDELAQSITEKIVEQYESVVRSRHFAKLLQTGCGPDCGTEQGGGCGTSGGCGSCGIAGACGTKAK